MQKIKWIYLIFIIICYSNTNCQNLSTNTITVDLSVKSKKKQSVAGFLHFNELEQLQNNISILKPKYWRFGAKLKEHTPKRKIQVDLLLKKNIVPIIVLSDIYDEEHWYKEKGGWIRPSDNGKPFTQLVSSLYKELGNKVVFDVWNEPNSKEVWGGTREEFFKTFKVAHDALRNSVDGKNAKITGPSISAYDKEYLLAFLDYCNKNNIQLDILNWHDLGNQQDAIRLKENIKEARELLKKYPKLGVKQIYIPEIVGLDEQFNPLTAFAYLNSLEESNAFGGCKACWDNPANKGENSCWNNSMDGILNADGKPRASWWLYKYYAESLEKRLVSKTDSKEFISNSYINKDNNFCLLMGNLSDKNYGTFKVFLKNIDDAKQFQNKSFKLYEITNKESAALEKPYLISQGKILLKNKSISLVLKNLKAKNLYYLVISKN
ncbi:hypothetical protein NZ698_15895 [Chryseobacterium sp. PBS4-4]|uniref:Glycosyl hydrolases family 39 N-terminal catalytic domain-containing protein n=1 Tax=Chryseobacterium edaphi TaxID=2976532 RepID=A0ABT2W8Y6_9FLAO|nr:hypothetical protein [Chryseobacterium edaphi]MCU7618678.1 hypothetical protein [Chryseobacterium edaphi]